MNIPKQFHQFTDEVALIVVAAKQEGRVYHAGNGILTDVDSFRIPTPHFSDNEEAPDRRGNQENTTEKKIHQEYMGHFKKLFHTLAGGEKPSHLYLFSPMHVAQELEDLTRTVFGALPTTVVVGIFTKQDPIELLEVLKSRSE